jgi:large subunit ribosomal protein L23
VRKGLGIAMLIDVCRWDKKMWDAGKKEQAEHEESYQPGFREKPSKERASIKEQAKAILSGKEKWKSTGRPQGLWEDVGEAREVETEVELPRPKQ